MKNIKLLWGIIVVLAIVVSLMGYKFVKGSVAKSDDNRTAVVLNKDERNLILGEMRAFLVSVQAVSQAITANDKELITQHATKAGMQAEADTPGSLFQKIPLSMKKLGFDTRKKFDGIAESAKNGADQLTMRKQLDTLMNNCIACHTIYKLPEPK